MVLGIPRLMNSVSGWEANKVYINSLLTWGFPTSLPNFKLLTNFKLLFHVIFFNKKTFSVTRLARLYVESVLGDVLCSFKSSSPVTHTDQTKDRLNCSGWKFACKQVKEQVGNLNRWVWSILGWVRYVWVVYCPLSTMRQRPWNYFPVNRFITFVESSWSWVWP